LALPHSHPTPRFVSGPCADQAERSRNNKRKEEKEGGSRIITRPGPGKTLPQKKLGLSLCVAIIQNKLLVLQQGGQSREGEGKFLKTKIYAVKAHGIS